MDVTYKQLLERKNEYAESEATKIIFKQTADAIVKALKWHTDILIISDKDCDGITSAKIMSEFVEAVTDIKPTVVIGDRFEGKYGIPEVDKLPLQNHTCVICLDIGSTERESLEQIARITGEKPIVIDHHEITDDMKDYKSMLNFTGRVNAPDYCTAGLAKRLFDEIYKEREGKITDKYPQMKTTVDIIGCIGTIADCVSVNNPYDLNRDIILNGFEKIREGDPEKIEPALGVFLESIGAFEKSRITTEFIQYSVAPLFNACGRLEKGGSQFIFDTFNDYAYSVECKERIAHMIEVNDLRKDIKREILESDSIKKFKDHIINDGKKIAVYVNSDIPQGITGLVASSLVEELNVPAIVVTKDATGTYTASGRNCKGFPNLHTMCGRAVEETVSLGAEIAYAQKNGADEKVPKEFKESYEVEHPFRFGGHADALGFSCDEAYLDILQEVFEMCYADVVPEKVDKDFMRDLSGMNPNKLYALEPFGVDYPQPWAEVKVEVSGKKNLKGRDDWVSFKAGDLKCITFSCGSEIENGDEVMINGPLSIDEFAGKPESLKIQFNSVEKIRTKEKEETELEKG